VSEHAEGEIAGEARWCLHGPLPTTRARSGGWSGAWISGLTRPGQAGPYAHHLDAIRRGEACLALVGEEPMPRVRSRGNPDGSPTDPVRRRVRELAGGGTAWLAAPPGAGRRGPAPPARPA